MDEDQYRATYHAVNQLRCPFEKSILSRRTNCRYGVRFNLADREGVTCKSEPTNLKCGETLRQIRNNALFALKLTQLDGQLPHAKEVKVQTGGLLGLQKSLDRPETDGVEDIADLVTDAFDRYGNPEQFPYPQIMQSVVRFEGRKRTRRKP